MGRVINPTPAARQRLKLIRGIASALHWVETEQCTGAEQRDCLAYMCLALRELEDSVASTASAWEKRSYWIKADNFQRQWKWVSEARTKLEALTSGEGIARPKQVRAALQDGLASFVHLPRETAHRPWDQAWKLWSERQ